MSPTPVDVLIIGAGVMGCSLAYHLAERKAGRVLVVEKAETYGTGSTGRSVGGIRLQFSTEINVRLSQISLEEYWEVFEERFGVDITLRQYGYLFLLSKPESWEQFQRNVALQNRLGVPSRLLTPQEAREIVPQLYIDDLIGATFCPKDGYADPYAANMGFFQAARRLGVQVRFEAEVTGFRVQDGRVRAVQVNGEEWVEAGTVLLAAGAWSGDLARKAGVDLPIRPYRRMVFATAPFQDLPWEMPLTIDFDSGAYCRRDGEIVLMGESNPEEPPSYRTDVDWDWLERVAEDIVHRIPVLERAGIQRGWAGLYAITPDAHPLVGPVPGFENFYVAAGFSGHGFQHAPATGKLLTQLILDGRSDLDLSPLAPDRFVRGKTLEEYNVV